MCRNPLSQQHPPPATFHTHPMHLSSSPVQRQQLPLAYPAAAAARSLLCAASSWDSVEGSLTESSVCSTMAVPTGAGQPAPRAKRPRRSSRPNMAGEGWWKDNSTSGRHWPPGREEPCETQGLFMRHTTGGTAARCGRRWPPVRRGLYVARRVILQVRQPGARGRDADLSKGWVRPLPHKTAQQLCCTA